MRHRDICGAVDLARQVDIDEGRGGREGQGSLNPEQPALMGDAQKRGIGHVEGTVWWEVDHDIVARAWDPPWLQFADSFHWPNVAGPIQLFPDARTV